MSPKTSLNKRIKYPIYFPGLEKYLARIVSPVNLNDFEAIDIEDKEYQFGWDSSGLKLKLFLDEKEVAVRVVSSIRKPKELREAVIQHAGLVGADIVFTKLVDSRASIASLFERADQLEASKSINWKRVFLPPFIGILVGIAIGMAVRLS